MGGRTTSDGRIAFTNSDHTYANGGDKGELTEPDPLAGLDEKARRFWRRVFRLVRIPGGRHLLGVLARRSRGRH